MNDFLDRHSAKLKVVLVVAAGFVIGYATGLLQSVIWNTIGFTVAGVGVYALLRYLDIAPFLEKRNIQFLVAITVSLLWALVGPAGVLSTIIFLVWGVIVLMCAFALSADFWENREIIEQQADEVFAGKRNPFDAARDAAKAGSQSVRRGFRDTHQEAHRASGLGREDPPEPPKAA